MKRVLPTINWVCSAAVLAGSCWLLYAAMWKVANHELFAAALGDHRLVPRLWIPFVAYAIPAVEAVSAIAAFLSLTGGRRWGGAVVLCVLFFFFSCYALALYRWPPLRPVGCGCGLSNEVVTNWAALGLRNAVISMIFGLIALLLVMARGVSVRVDPQDDMAGATAPADS